MPTNTPEAERLEVLAKPYEKLAVTIQETTLAIGDRKDSVLVLVPMLRSLQAILDGALKLAGSGNSAPALALTRPIWESCLNIGYVTCVGGNLSDRMLRHAKQKLARNLKRENRIGDDVVSFEAQDADELLADAEISQQMAEFTRKSGKELTQWCEADLDGRILAIRDVDHPYAARLQVSMLMCYRNASEILHGTLAGALIGFGVSDLKEFEAADPRGKLELEAKLFHQFRILGGLVTETVRRVTMLVPDIARSKTLWSNCNDVWISLRDLVPPSDPDVPKAYSARHSRWG